jgi:glutaconate CoA-transferase, subunit B
MAHDLPDARTLSPLRGRIVDELAETYPAFARAMLQAA